MPSTSPEGIVGLRKVSFDKYCPASTDVELHIKFQPLDSDWSFTIKNAHSQRLHASGVVFAQPQKLEAATWRWLHTASKESVSVDTQEVYRALGECDLKYARPLQGLSSCLWDPHARTGFADLTVDEKAHGKMEEYVLHPALLDQWLQMSGLPLLHLAKARGKMALRAMPTGMECLQVLNAGKLSCRMQGFVQLNQEFGGEITISGAILSLDGVAAVEIRHATVRLLLQDDGIVSTPLKDLCWEMELKKLAPKPQSQSPFWPKKQLRCVVIPDSGGVANRLVEGLITMDSVWLEIRGGGLGQVGRSLADGEVGGFASFDAIIFVSSGGHQIGALESLSTIAEAEQYFTNHLEAVQVLRELVSIISSQQAPRPYVWTIVTDDSDKNPACSSLMGLVKNLVFENVLSEPLLGSKLKLAELKNADGANLAVLRKEILRPRQDCSEIVVRAGQAWHHEVAHAQWSWCDLLARRSHGCQQRPQLDSAAMSSAMASEQLCVFEGLPSSGMLKVDVDALWTPTLVPVSDQSQLKGDLVGRLEADRDWVKGATVDDIVEFVGRVHTDGLRHRVVGCSVGCFKQNPMNTKAGLLWSEHLLEPPAGVIDYTLALEVLELLEGCVPAPPASAHIAFWSPVGKFEGLLRAILHLARICHNNQLFQVTTMPVTTGQHIHSFDTPFDGIIIESGPDVAKHLDFLAKSRGNVKSHTTVLLLHTGSIPEVNRPSKPTMIGVSSLQTYSFVELDVGLLLQEPVMIRSCQKVRKILERSNSDQPYIGHAVPQSSCMTWQSRDALFIKEASYLLTGALRVTGLGWLVAEWLALKGAGTLLLCGRRMPEGAELQSLTAAACMEHTTVVLERADVTSNKGIDTLIQTISSLKSRNSPLKGIFHGAAVFRDGLFSSTTPEDFEQVLKPKVLGTLNLHLLETRTESKLDYFVVQSSIVSFLGNFGQASYGAANAFQDAFATWRRSRGLQSNAINWTSLSNVGVMAGRQEMERHLAETRGFASINKGDIVKAFEAALLMNKPRLAVAKFDFENLGGLALAKDPEFQGRFACFMQRYGWAESAGVAAPQEKRRRIENIEKEPVESAGEEVRPSGPPRDHEQSSHLEQATGQSVGEEGRSREPTPGQAQSSRIEEVTAERVGEEGPFEPPPDRAQSRQITKILEGILDNNNLQGNVSLVELGLDSGLAIEARQQLSQKLEVDAPLDLLLSEEPIAVVVAKLCRP